MIKQALLIAMIAAPGFASADFLRSDFESVGDNLLITDTTTGVEYLDLSVTSSLSVDGLKSQSGDGQRFNGYSLASYDLIQDLAFSFFGEDYTALISNNESSTGVVSDASILGKMIDFADAFGVVREDANDINSYAMYDNIEPSVSYNLMFGVNLKKTSGDIDRGNLFVKHYNPEYGYAFEDDFTNSASSLWVVSDKSIQNYNYNRVNISDVNTPSTLASIFLIGSFAYLRRKSL